MRNTRSTPAMAAAVRMSGLALPSFIGGVTMMSSSTPAILAGTAFISTEEGYAAVPPGTYSPTRFSPRMRWPRMTPFSLGFTKLWCFCRLWKSAMFSMEFSRVETKSGSALVRASLISSRLTSRAGGSFPSNFRVYSSTALSPFFRTFSRISETVRVTFASTSPLRERRAVSSACSSTPLAVTIGSIFILLPSPRSEWRKSEPPAPFSAASGWRC